MVVFIVGCASFPLLDRNAFRIDNFLLSNKSVKEFGDYKRQRTFEQGQVFWIYAELVNLTIIQIDDGRKINVIGYLIVKDSNDNIIASGLLIDYDGYVKAEMRPDEIYVTMGFNVPVHMDIGRYILQLEITDNYNYETAIAITILKVKKKTVHI